MNDEQEEFCTLNLVGIIDPTAATLNMESAHFELFADGCLKLTLTGDDGTTLLTVRLEGAKISGSIIKEP